MDYDVDVACDGMRIDATNKEEITKYKSIDEWHAVAVKLYKIKVVFFYSKHLNYSFVTLKLFTRRRTFLKDSLQRYLLPCLKFIHVIIK